MNTGQIFLGLGGMITGLVLIYLTITILQADLDPNVAVMVFFQTREGIQTVRVMTALFSIYALAMLISSTGLIDVSPDIDTASKALAGTSLLGFIFFQIRLLRSIKTTGADSG